MDPPPLARGWEVDPATFRLAALMRYAHDLARGSVPMLHFCVGRDSAQRLFMTIYTIRSHGRNRDAPGFTLIALESDGEERPIIIFPTEEQAKESVASLRREEITMLRNTIKGTAQTLGGSCRFSKGRVRVGSPIKSMPKPGTERAVIDGATNLEQ